MISAKSVRDAKGGVGENVKSPHLVHAVSCGALCVQVDDFRI